MNHKNIKIIGLPFAGGNKYSYRMYEDLTPKGFEWISIDLPGHGTRIREQLISDFSSLAGDVFNQIKAEIKSNEYIIYGHSMGTILAYELAKEIQKEGYNLPKCLFMTGREAPSIPETDNPTVLDSKGFWDYVKKKGGLPKELLANDELLEFFEPIIRADFKTIKNYKYEPLNQPFSFPIHVQIGKEEEITKEEMMSWQKETILPLQYKILEGDHFFIQHHAQQIIDDIINASKSLISL